MLLHVGTDKSDYMCMLLFYKKCKEISTKFQTWWYIDWHKTYWNITPIFGWFPMFLSFQDCQLLIIIFDADMCCNVLPYRIFWLNIDTHGCSLFLCKWLHIWIMHKLQIKYNRSICRWFLPIKRKQHFLMFNQWTQILFSVWLIWYFCW